MTLADTGASEAVAAAGDKAADAVASGAAAVQGATDAAAQAVQRDNGWFGFFTGPFENLLKVRIMQIWFGVSTCTPVCCCKPFLALACPSVKPRSVCWHKP